MRDLECVHDWSWFRKDTAEQCCDFYSVCCWLYVLQAADTTLQWLDSMICGRTRPAPLFHISQGRGAPAITMALLAVASS